MFQATDDWTQNLALTENKQRTILLFLYWLPLATHFVQALPIHVFDSYTNLSQLKMYRSSLEEMNHILENKPRHVPLNPSPGEEIKNLERIVEYNIVMVGRL